MSPKTCPLSGHEKEELHVENWGPIVTVRVGIEKKEFSCHRELLCSHSYRIYVGLNRVRNGSLVLDLPEHDAENFGVFLSWIYKRELWSPNRDQGAPWTTSKLALPFTLTRLCELYVSGQKLSAPAFQNIIIDTLVANLGDPSEPALELDQCIEFVYAQTHEHSYLRKLLVHLYAGLPADIRQTKFRTDLESITQARFHCDVVVMISEYQRWPNIAKPGVRKDACAYHSHHSVLQRIEMYGKRKRDEPETTPRKRAANHAANGTRENPHILTSPVSVKSENNIDITESEPLIRPEKSQIRVEAEDFEQRVKEEESKISIKREEEPGRTVKREGTWPPL